MAAKTVPGNIGVVKISRYPGHRRVTVVAVVAAGNMVLGFAIRINIVMTRHASAYDLCVVDRDGGLPER